MLEQIKANVGKRWNNEKAAFNRNRSKYIVDTLKWGLPLAMFAMVLAGVAVPGAFAQTGTTLDIDTEAMTTSIFTGANIVIAALGAVMFLIAGFKLGGVLIRGIVDSVSNIRF